VRSCAPVSGAPTDSTVPRHGAWRLGGDETAARGLAGAARRRRPSGGVAGRVQWLPFDDVLAAAGSPGLRDPRTLAALTVAARRTSSPTGRAPGAGAGCGAGHTSERRVRLSEYALRSPVADVDRPGAEHFLNGDLSLIEFNARVLELRRTRASRSSPGSGFCPS